MAGETHTHLIPGLERFRPEWLDSAEVSLSLDGLRVTGLSFFFHDEASCGEFAAGESLDEAVMSAERVLRAKYSILPRYWLKIHYDGTKQCGLSQYFHINPGMHYPISTIRRFLRDYGFADAGMLEGLLKPSLEERGTRWGLAIKRSADKVFPRIFFSVARPFLKQVLAPFIRSGYLSDIAALFYLQWEQRIVAGGRVFISIDPTFSRFSSLDFCDLPSSQVPGCIPLGLPETVDYLKMRITGPSRPPEFTAYMPLVKVQGLLRGENNVDGKAVQQFVANQTI